MKLTEKEILASQKVLNKLDKDLWYYNFGISTDQEFIYWTSEDFMSVDLFKKDNGFVLIEQDLDDYEIKTVEIFSDFTSALNLFDKLVTKWDAY